MTDTTLVLLVFGDLVAGFLIWLYLNDHLSRFKWFKAALLKSLVYSLFFGIGALGEGGGDPGFMLPYLILPAAIVELVDGKLNVFVQNALVPYMFWAVVLFGIYSIKQAIRYLKKRVRLGKQP